MDGVTAGSLLLKIFMWHPHGTTNPGLDILEIPVEERAYSQSLNHRKSTGTLKYVFTNIV